MEAREAIKVLSLAVCRCQNGDHINRALHAAEEIEACSALSLHIGESMMLELEAQELLLKCSKPGGKVRSGPALLSDVIAAYGEVSMASAAESAKGAAKACCKP